MAFYSLPVIFVVISVLVVAFIYSSYSGFEAFAEPADPNWGELSDDEETVTCCWTEPDLYDPGETVTWCQICDFYGTNCGPLQVDSSPTGPFAPLQDGVLEEQPQPSGPTAPPQDGGVLQPPPAQGITPPLTRGQGVLPQDGGFATRTTAITANRSRIRGTVNRTSNCGRGTTGASLPRRSRVR